FVGYIKLNSSLAKYPSPFFVDLFIFYFFFQAEDGIRDRTVTGVQTCALPISGTARTSPARRRHCGCRTRTRSRMKCNQAYIERHEMVTRAGAAPQRDGGRRRPRDERVARGARRAHRPRAGPCRRALLPLARTRRLAPHWRESAVPRREHHEAARDDPDLPGRGRGPPGARRL